VSTDPARDTPGQRLCEEARALPLSILQLGTKSRWLIEAGYVTVGELADTDLEALRDLKAIGSKTVNLARQRLDALAGAGIDGRIDWQRFADAVGIPLLPSRRVATGGDLLSAMPGVLAELAGHLRDDVYRDILSNRLLRPPGCQATLEEIGQRSIPPVTRERIRQKEAKLLAQLTGAILWNNDGKLGVQFHPDFTGWWQRAADEFDGVEEIGVDEFIGRLERTWNVPAHALAEQLPFIIAIVTGEAQMPTAFRTGARLDPRLRRLSQEAGTTPVLRFRWGKAGDRLQVRGLTTLSDLVRSVSDGRLGQPFTQHLATIATAIRDDGTIDWDAYAAASDLLPLPSRAPASPDAFLDSFPQVIGILLERLYPSGRAARIFELRTRHPAGPRLTLAAVAERLHTHGPTVKREETIFLQDLHDVLVDREFTEVPIWLDQLWLDYCSEAHAAFEVSGSDYQRFLASLAHRWRVTPGRLGEAAPGLWAIFSGYPEGRCRRPATEEVSVPVEPLAARIQLRGFRRVH